MSRDEIGRDLDRLPTTGEELDTVLAAAVEILRRINPRAAWIGVYERDDDDVYRLGMFDGCPTVHPFQLDGDWPAATAMRDGQPCRPSDPGTDLFVPLRHADRLFGCLFVRGSCREDVDDRFVAEAERISKRLGECYASRSVPLAVGTETDIERPRRTA
jgi:hypothetical protein